MRGLLQIPLSTLEFEDYFAKVSNACINVMWDEGEPQDADILQQLDKLGFPQVLWLEIKERREFIGRLLLFS